jgi:hypothetical protein
MLIALDDNNVDNPLWEDIWEVMPMREGVVNYLPAGKTLKLNSFLPKSR